MPRAFFYQSIATDNRGPLSIGIGLVVVLGAQLWPVIPLAVGIALIGLGSTLTLNHRRRNELLLALNLAVYVSLVVLAVSAQLDQRLNLITLCDAVAAAAVLAAALTCAIVPNRRT